MRFHILFAFSLLFLGCNSEKPVETHQTKIEPPKLIAKMERDSITQTWSISYELGAVKDTIFTETKANYQFIDTANLDGIGLPEYIVLRDSLISQGSGIDQRGFWSYGRSCSVIDIWSLDRKEILVSFIQSEHHHSTHSDELIPRKSEHDQKDGINLKWVDFYEYDVEFNFGEIVISNLRIRERSNLKPNFIEGRYRLIDGALKMIKN